MKNNEKQEILSKDQEHNLIKEFQFYTSKSGGPGGQHVNKTNSKVIIKWSVEQSEVLNENQKALLNHKLTLSSGMLIVSCESERSQLKNKTLAIKKLIGVITKSLKVPKPRKKSKPTKASVKKRLTSKKLQSEKKENRKPPSF